MFSKPRPRSVAAASLLLASSVVVGSCGPVGSFAQPEPIAMRSTSPIGPAQAPAAAEHGTVESRTFESVALARTMPYVIYLPPGYAMGTERFRVLYMLHGMSGTDDEWRSYGLFDVADRMIASGEIAPMLIVLPQGDKAYWVDHVGADREAWGRYTARDVVAEIDSRFRTLADRQDRAIGGVSMGAHGAVQLALNYPDTFSAVGAHSLVLRRYGSAPPYFGGPTEYAKRDPMELILHEADVARTLALWIDIGDADPWASLADRFAGELGDLQIDHVWHEWPGDHSAKYWSAHLPDYLHFYDSALARAARHAAALAAHDHRDRSDPRLTLTPG